MATRGHKGRAKASVRSRLGIEERRAQLLALGLEMFSAKSYDDVSIDDVAVEAGISKGLLYHYFPTKRDFYAATVKEASRQLLLLTDLPETTEPLSRLTHGMERYLAFVERCAPAYSTLMRGGIGSDRELAEVIEDTRRVLLERLVRGLKGSAPGVEVDALTVLALRGWIGFVEATSLDWLDRRDVPRGTLLSLWANTLLMLVPSLEVLRGDSD